MGGRVGHVVVVLIVLVIVQVEDGNVLERWEGGIGDNNNYDNDNWTDGREGEPDEDNNDNPIGGRGGMVAPER